MLTASAQKVRRAMKAPLEEIQEESSLFSQPPALPVRTSPRIGYLLPARYAVCAIVMTIACIIALCWIPPVKASIQRGLRYIYDDRVVYCYPTSPEYDPQRLRHFTPPLPEDQVFMSRRLDTGSNCLQVTAGNDSGASFKIELYPSGEAQVEAMTRYSHLYQEQVEGVVVNLYAYYEPSLEECPTGEFNAVWECEGITFSMRLYQSTQEKARSLIRATIEAFLLQP